MLNSQACERQKKFLLFLVQCRLRVFVRFLFLLIHTSLFDASVDCVDSSSWRIPSNLCETLAVTPKCSSRERESGREHWFQKTWIVMLVMLVSLPLPCGSDKTVDVGCFMITSFCWKPSPFLNLFLLASLAAPLSLMNV